MKVVLQKTGVIKDVADGYARNYLIPNGLAVAATDKALTAAKEQQAAHAAETAAKASQWEALAKTLENKPVSISAQANADGTLFGSVDAAQISAAAAAADITLESNWISLPEHIKTTGSHAVSVTFPNKMTGTLTLVVNAK